MSSEQVELWRAIMLGERGGGDLSGTCFTPAPCWLGPRAIGLCAALVWAGRRGAVAHRTDGTSRTKGQGLEEDQAFKGWGGQGGWGWGWWQGPCMLFIFLLKAPHILPPPQNSKACLTTSPPDSPRQLCSTYFPHSLPSTPTQVSPPPPPAACKHALPLLCASLFPPVLSPCHPYPPNHWLQPTFGEEGGDLLRPEQVSGADPTPPHSPPQVLRPAAVRCPPQ